MATVSQRCPGGSETVLVAEDERVVREVTSRVLRWQGYTVLEAAEGVDALGLVLGHPETRVDLLVTDVVMPLMSGWELAERLKEYQPSIRVIYISGYTRDVMSHPALQAQGAAFIAKPFTPVQLAHTVRRCWRLDRALIVVGTNVVARCIGGPEEIFGHTGGS